MSDIEHINVLAELERCGIAFQWASESEVKTLCPFHDDHSPSCFVNVEERVFKCHVHDCDAKGDIVSFLARKMGVPRAVVLADLSKRYTLDTTKIIDMAVIERYHQNIWSAGPLLKALYDRAMTDDDIRKYRWGEHDGRIMIPIPNAAGMIINVRKYLPGAPGDQKMKNMKGRSRPELYPEDQMKYDEIVLVGGEAKAVVGARELNKHDIGCVTVTAGEGNWSTHLTPRFKGKRVHACMDIDAAGRAAAETTCARLHTVATWIGDILLPLDAAQFPKGDVNDYVKNGGSMKRAVNTSIQWVPKARCYDGQEETAEEVELAGAIDASKTAKRVCVHAVVSAVDTTPYIIPKDITVKCDRSQNECAGCAVFRSGVDDFGIPSESPALLEMVATSRTYQREAIMRGIGIPVSCKVATFEVKSYYSLEDARISPPLEITSRAADRMMQPALCIGGGIELNEPYKLVGRMHPHPKTQQSTLLISRYKHTQDALSTYKCTDLDTLELFRPNDWSSSAIQRRLDDVYDDIEANVTRIYQRRDLHLTVDLTYHSPLLLRFDDKTVKGWLETLVVGDSSQGKSEVACGSNGPGGLMGHYGLGAKVECKNATVAGLLGGLQKSGDRYFVSWGVIPTHDKRLVILEELKGAHPEVIAKLTDMRSSGIAEIPKIEKRRTHARTRLIALSNPRSDHPISSYNFGIEAVKELIGSLEDIRRFDMALIVSKSELDPNVLNKLSQERRRVNHNHTGELCRSLILWAWTRTENQVHFAPEATALVLEEATKLSNMFTDAIPLVDRGSLRYKLARLAAALAGRTFSASEDCETMIVLPCHVEFVSQWLKRVYGSPIFGYSEYTSAMSLTTNLLDPVSIKKRIVEVPHPKDFLHQLLHTATIELVDIQDWCGWGRADAMKMLSFLVRKHALIRDGRAYRKTSSFIALVREVIERGEFFDRPDHIGESDF